jgi:hypothetical protein
LTSWAVSTGVSGGIVFLEALASGSYNTSVSNNNFTNNTTKPPTDVTTAQLVNSQETELDNKIKDAEHSLNHVTKMVRSNLTNNNAMLAQVAVMMEK